MFATSLSFGIDIVAGRFLIWEKGVWLDGECLKTKIFVYELNENIHVDEWKGRG